MDRFIKKWHTRSNVANSSQTSIATEDEPLLMLESFWKEFSLTAAYVETNIFQSINTDDIVE